MGRKKGYTRAGLIDAATPLFHTHGFEGTSTEMLVRHLEVNRNSLFSEFGTKRALFDEVVERYDDTMVTSMLGALERDDAGLDTIGQLFAAFGADSLGRFAGMGCLMCNTAVELGAETPDGNAPVLRYFERLNRAFANALGNAQRAGELDPGLDVDVEAGMLCATALGLFVMARARAPAAMVRAVVSSATRHVDLIRAPHPSHRAVLL
jgi:TetR/AcrR family transcriptional repressor of nem operon